MPSSKSQKDSKSESARVQVAVRVRPFNIREKAGSQASVVHMNSSQKAVSIESERGSQTFQFDNVFWSMDCPDEEGNPPAEQADVYAEIGRPLLSCAFNGFNSCLFAYGQTGSGKTHTMMGGRDTQEELGVIPRLCKELFQVKADREFDGVSKWTVMVGFIEVYNEKVSDLLAPPEGHPP